MILNLKFVSNSKKMFALQPVKVCHHSGCDLREEDDGEESRVGQDERVALAADAAATHQSHNQNQNSWNENQSISKLVLSD